MNERYVVRIQAAMRGALVRSQLVVCHKEYSTLFKDTFRGALFKSGGSSLLDASSPKPVLVCNSDNPYDVSVRCPPAKGASGYAEVERQIRMLLDHPIQLH